MNACQLIFSQIELLTLSDYANVTIGVLFKITFYCITLIPGTIYNIAAFKLEFDATASLNVLRAPILNPISCCTPA